MGLDPSRYDPAIHNTTLEHVGSFVATCVSLYLSMGTATQAIPKLTRDAVKRGTNMLCSSNDSPTVLLIRLLLLFQRRSYPAKNQNETKLLLLGLLQLSLDAPKTLLIVRTTLVSCLFVFFGFMETVCGELT
jgi:hypothetical protein